MDGWEGFDYARSRRIKNSLIPIDKVMRFIDPSSTDRILEIGAGDGEYAEALAKAAHSGVVVAMEFTEAASKLIEQRIVKSGLKNLELWRMNACLVEDFSKFEKIFMSDVFHDIECKDRLLEMVHKSAERGMQLILIEFKKSSKIGPPESIKLSEKQLDGIMSKHGFELLGRIELEQHYMAKYRIAD
ncbi:MAG: class I SAM-dependent methyltransferase [Candidatus Micrarchaeaceae archaeon]